MSTIISENGAHISAEPVTTTIAEAASPTLLRSHVDERIARIRPSSTPLDQISRMVGARRSGSMKVDFYSVDVREGSLKASSALNITPDYFGKPMNLNVDVPELLAESDTLLFPTVTVREESGAKHPLVCYVASVSRNQFQVKAVGGKPEGNLTVNIGDPIVRMGRAAGELDVQTPQYTALPVKDYNYCQIFKAQIEESMLQRLADKEVGWGFPDREESAIVDMRMGMEKSFLFGTRARIDTGTGEEIMLTGGVWNQAGKTHEYDPEAFDDAELVSIMRHAFEKGGGSERKVLLAGSELIERLSRLEVMRTVSGTEKKVVWGIDFDCMVSKFGTFYVKLSEIFDLCGMSGCGIIIDPEFITKYSHIPFQAERISFQKQGVRNTEAVVLTEASCLVLRFPQAHMRLVPKAAATGGTTA